MAGDRCLVLFTKPAHPGRVKTRLIGELDAEQAAALHQAFLDDLTSELSNGCFDLVIAWAAGRDEPVPDSPWPSFRQQGGDLGERMLRGLRRAAERYPLVAAVGSDHPELASEQVERAFELLEDHQVVVGPAGDGGYYLIGARRESLRPELFASIEWSTSRVLAATLDRCRELGLDVGLLPPGEDVDTPEDLERLAATLTAAEESCPRTRRLLSDWGMLEER